MEKRLKGILISIILLVELFGVGFNDSTKAQHDVNTWIEIKIKNEFVIKGQSLNLTINSNSLSVNVLIYSPSGIIGYNKTWVGNESRLIPINNGVEYGIYRIDGISGDVRTSSYFTVLHIGDWVTGGQDARHFTWMNTRYDIDGVNWILNVTGPRGELIQWSFEDLKNRKIAHDMNAYLLRNEHTVYAEINKTNIGSIKIYLFKTHRGVKLTQDIDLDDSIPIPRFINFTIDAYNDISGNIISSGNLHLDLSDALETLGDYSYDPITKIIKWDVDSRRVIFDPIFFTSGFESGTLSGDGFTGNVTGSGDTITISEVGAYKGNYGMIVENDGNNGDITYAYKTVSQGNDTYARVYINLKETESSFQQLMAFRAFNMHVMSIYWDQAVGTDNIQIGYRNGTTFMFDNNAQEITMNTWHYIELHYHQHETDGYAEAWFNGVLLDNMTGMNTYEYGEIDTVRIGEMENGPAVVTYFDQFVVSSSYIGAELYYYEDFEDDDFEDIFGFSQGFLEEWNITEREPNFGDKRFEMNHTGDWSARGFFYKQLPNAIDWIYIVSEFGTNNTAHQTSTNASIILINEIDEDSGFDGGDSLRIHLKNYNSTHFWVGLRVLPNGGYTDDSAYGQKWISRESLLNKVTQFQTFYNVSNIEHCYARFYVNGTLFWSWDDFNASGVPSGQFDFVRNMLREYSLLSGPAQKYLDWLDNVGISENMFPYNEYSPLPPPSYYFNINDLLYSTKKARTRCTLSVTLETNSTPSYYWFGHNISGTWENETIQPWVINGTYTYDVDIINIIGYPIGIIGYGNTTDNGTMKTTMSVFTTITDINSGGQILNFGATILTGIIVIILLANGGRKRR